MEEFKKHCALIKQLIDAGEVVVHVVNSNLIEFRYNDEYIDHFARKNTLEVETFRNDLKQIPFFMVATIQDALPLLFRYLIRNVNNMKDAERKNQEQLIEEKVKIVQDTFITPTIKKIFTIKSNAKGRLLSSFEWEVDQKLYDKSSEELRGNKYAQVLVSTATRDRRPTMPFFASFFPELDFNDNLVLTLTIDDIDYLLKELNELKGVLADEQRR